MRQNGAATKKLPAISRLLIWSLNFQPYFPVDWENWRGNWENHEHDNAVAVPFLSFLLLWWKISVCKYRIVWSPLLIGMPGSTAVTWLWTRNFLKSMAIASPLTSKKAPSLWTSDAELERRQEVSQTCTCILYWFLDIGTVVCLKKGGSPIKISPSLLLWCKHCAPNF